MVVDPFTIAGAFGLAAGLVGFIASTVEKAAGQINTANNADVRLQIFDIALKTCQRRLETWAQQWHSHEEMTKEDLRFLWGSQGLEEVEQIKISISKEQDDLLKLLYGRKWFKAHGQEAGLRWEGILQGQEDALRQNHPAPPAPLDYGSKDIYCRISTALWNNSLLSGSVDRLKGLVDSLETTSRLRFHEAQQSAYCHSQPSDDEIESVLRQRRRMQNLALALSVAYQNLRPSAGSCELLFTNFDRAEMCRLEMQNDLAVTFLIKHAPARRSFGQYRYRRLDIRHPLDSIHGSFISEQAREMMQSEPRASDMAERGHTIRGEFLHINKLGRRQQDVYREDIRLDCMATAVCIGAWSMLTWKSRWLNGLSSCRIAQMHFRDGETWPVFAPDFCSPDASTPTGHDLKTLSYGEPDECTSCHLENRPYLLLAVLLAELALACPISTQFGGGKTFFDVHSTSHPTQSVQRHSNSQLVDEIRSATSWYYGTAVKYCLKQDAKTCSGSGVSLMYNHAHFYRRVIEPLDKHYRALQKHIEDHPQLYERFRQEAKRL